MLTTSTPKNLQEDKVMGMMKNMGWAPGKGLGKNKQGITEPIEARTKIGRRGLGIETEQQHKEFEAILDDELENKPVEETPEWLECTEEQRIQVDSELNNNWIKLDIPITKDDQFISQDRYCSSELIAELVEAKSMFDTVDRKDLEAARSRANPYETIKAGFFQNRAAMKTANLDKIFGWRLSREFDEQKRLAKNPLGAEIERANLDRCSPLYYFADVCAGPGGFSEYMLWRKAYYNAKGFGFTLTGKDDFKLDRFKAAPPEYFEPYYGVKENGDVMDPENLLSLQKFVHDRIGNGVHLVMCDGGFSVDGNENLQEVLSKRLYLCQFIVGLSLCRAAPSKTIKENGQQNSPSSSMGKGGNFLCKLFDMFTPFSMGLIYLMYCSFERISIHKPITSRPANSERYIFCENLNEIGAGKVKEYLMEVNNRMDEMDRSNEDIMELVPDEVIRNDDNFMQYISANIEKIARRQLFYLRKYKHYAATPGTFDQDQSKLRDQALSYWELPDYIERPREIHANRKRNWHISSGEEQYQKPESITQLFQRLCRNQITFPYKQRTARFTEEVVGRCPDVAEFRALLLPEHEEPILLISQGAGRLLMHRRNGSNFEGFMEVNTTIPENTILLIQSTSLFELKEGTDKIEAVGKCLWVLDAALLNGDDISQLDLKARNAAARKFATAMNRLQTREAIFERDPNARDRRRSKFAGHRHFPFCELIVAEPKRLKALTEQKFEIKQFKGSRMAFFPVWARNDRRAKPPKKHFIACRGVRIQNVLNPNFMLICNERNEETVFAREGATLGQNQCTNFYASFRGFVQPEHLITSYPDGHPHGGAITFHWSWEPDYTAEFTMEHILNLEQHPAGLTLRGLRRLIEERQRQAKGQLNRVTKGEEERGQTEMRRGAKRPNQSTIIDGGDESEDVVEKKPKMMMPEGTGEQC